MNRPVRSVASASEPPPLLRRSTMHAVDLVLLELAEQLLDVARGALVVGVAAAARVEILVERRQRDHADVARVIAGLAPR